MGQTEIAEILKIKNKWLSIKELMVITGQGRGSISCLCKKLIKRNEVQSKTVRGKDKCSHWITYYRIREDLNDR